MSKPASGICPLCGEVMNWTNTNGTFEIICTNDHRKFNAIPDALFSIQIHELDQDSVQLTVTSNMSDETDRLFHKVNAYIFGRNLAESIREYADGNTLEFLRIMLEETARELTEVISPQ